MDPRTGHLIELQSDEALPDGYVRVPAELEHAARQKFAQAQLAERKAVYVSLTSGGRLSQFARDKRRGHQNGKKKRRAARRRRKR